MQELAADPTGAFHAEVVAGPVVVLRTPSEPPSPTADLQRRVELVPGRTPTLSGAPPDAGR